VDIPQDSSEVNWEKLILKIKAGEHLSLLGLILDPIPIIK
jgi:hypothetical protein